MSDKKHQICTSCGRCVPACGCRAAELCSDLRCNGNTLSQLRAENAELKVALETERLRLAACGVAAMQNTKESQGKNRVDKDSPYYSGSYANVCDAVDREMSLMAQLSEAERRAERMGELLKRATFQHTGLLCGWKNGEHVCTCGLSAALKEAQPGGGGEDESTAFPSEREWRAHTGRIDFAAGRQSVRASLVEACRALEKEVFRQERDDGGAFNYLVNAVAAIKAAGNWCGEE